ncbi:tetratricopeptide repeat-containing sulfotransferase family protein [Oceanicaulis sp.]|uniref:tetratricopeptide repeat-containing sulfotransferase family protein n=1 Tax=Oceanicaulis sp. TaxID=1924941 RepID=UPI003BADB44F
MTAARSRPQPTLAGRSGRTLASWVEREPQAALAAAQAERQTAPDNLLAMHVEAEATRRLGDAKRALELADTALGRHVGHPALTLEASRALADLGRLADAIARVEALTQVVPDFAPGWRTLAELREKAGDAAGALEAARRQAEASARPPELIEAAELIQAGKLGRAEHILRSFVKAHPTDVSGIRLLADVALRLGVLEDARRLLERVLELAPDFHMARHDYANCLIKLQKFDQAEHELSVLAQAEPDHPGHKVLLALLRVRTGRHEDACEIYAQILTDNPHQARIQMSYGHALKTIGRREDAIRAYRAAIKAEPTLGEAYWSLANLKTVTFNDTDITGMREALSHTEISVQDRYHLQFALGKALEDNTEFTDAFRAYETGNALRRKTVLYDADRTRAETDRVTQFFTAQFFEARKDWGDPSPDPIFILGLPRSGSTLLEQILASHPEIDGTFELPDIISIARRLSGKKHRTDESLYPGVLETLGQDEVRALGAEYLQRTATHRQGAPYFIDKMPNNCMHVGLIRLILPNAKIIDARRNPLACGFSNFKQLFARGQNFSYDLEDIGHYYSDYLRVMRAFDAAQPGAALRVIYEDLVADFEPHVRRLLAYVGVAFHPDCVNFHSTDRAVRTASSEQVRQPIYQSGTTQWLNFEEQLAPLKTVLKTELTPQRHWDR